MNRMCRGLPTRSWRKARLTWQELFPNAAIVTDPKKLAQLNAAVETRKQKEKQEAGLRNNG
jgi:hypothetical protein